MYLDAYEYTLNGNKHGCTGPPVDPFTCTVESVFSDADLEIEGKPWAGKNLMVVTTNLGNVTIHNSSHKAKLGNESFF